MQSIFLADVVTVVEDGFVDAAELCKGLETECEAAGITV